jgi:hypothetical protein
MLAFGYAGESKAINGWLGFVLGMAALCLNQSYTHFCIITVEIKNHEDKHL